MNYCWNAVRLTGWFYFYFFKDNLLAILYLYVFTSYCFFLQIINLKQLIYLKFTRKTRAFEILLGPVRFGWDRWDSWRWTAGCCRASMNSGSPRVEGASENSDYLKMNNFGLNLCFETWKVNFHFQKCQIVKTLPETSDFLLIKKNSLLAENVHHPSSILFLHVTSIAWEMSEIFVRSDYPEFSEGKNIWRIFFEDL